MHVKDNITPGRKLSKYLPFFGTGTNGIAGHAFIVFCVIVAILFVLFVCLTSLTFLIKKYKSSLIWQSVVCTVYSFLFILAIVYSVLLETDVTMNVKIISTLMVVLTVLYVPVLISSWALLFWIWAAPQQNLKVKKVDIKQQLEERDAGIDDLFSTVRPYKYQIRSIKHHHATELIDQSLFFDYFNFGQLRKHDRKSYAKNCFRRSLLDKGNMWKIILYFVLPAAVSQMVFFSYTLFDKFFVVQFAPHAYASTGLSHGEIVDQINIATRYVIVIDNLIMAGPVMLSTSASLMFSYAFGRKNPVEVRRVVGNSFTAGAFVSVITVVIAISLAPYLILFQSASSDKNNLAYKMAYPFVIIMVSSLPIRVLQAVGLNLIRAEGHPNVSLIILICSCFSNILLNFVLVKYTMLGLDGSAAASFSVFAITAFASWGYILFNRTSWIRCGWKDLKINTRLFPNFFILGFVNFVLSFVFGISILITGHIVGTLPFTAKDNPSSGGNTGTMGLMIAYSAISSWLTLIVQIAQGIGIGIMVVLGYCYAQHKIKRCHQLVKTMFYLMTTWSLSMVLMFLILRVQLIKLYVRDDRLPIHKYAWFLFFYCCVFIFTPLVWATTYVLLVTLQAKKAIYLALLRTWVIYLSILFILWGIGWVIASHNPNNPLGGGMFFYFRSCVTVISTSVGFFYYRALKKQFSQILKSTEAESQEDKEIKLFEEILILYDCNLKKIVKNFCFDDIKHKINKSEEFLHTKSTVY